MKSSRFIPCLIILCSVCCNGSDLKPSIERLSFLAFFNPGRSGTSLGSISSPTTSTQQKQQQQNASAITDKSSLSSAVNTSACTEHNTNNSSSSPDFDPRRSISISKSISVPFSMDLAFDVFSDWPRQADFNPYLRKVEYIVPHGMLLENVDKIWGETKWTMSIHGLPISWHAICTRLDRAGGCIQWKSTSGMKNFGAITFEEEEEHGRVQDNAFVNSTKGCKVTMTLTFVAPRLLVALFRRTGGLVHFAQEQMLAETLANFRDQVMAALSKELVVQVGEDLA